MSYENKILQMKKLLGKKKEVKEESQPKYQKPSRPSYVKNWEDAGLTLIENDFGVLFKREVRYPLDYKHGKVNLSSFFHAVDMWQNSNIDHPFSIDSNERVIFFDTETTGLKGVGTYIFLLGLLEFCEREFVLTQYVLADPSNEAAFLFESKFWKQQTTIVTYNGKSFDWPQLETRWTMNQNALPKLKQMRQIDLLHSTKRLWKNNLERMKLTLVEEEKLGFRRIGDIPGHLAPIVYLDAVKSGNAHALMKVLVHNEWDLLSLVTLYSISTNLLLVDEIQDSAITHTNIGKWYGDLKNEEKAQNVLYNVTDNFDAHEAGNAYFLLAFQQKRKSLYKEAAISFEKSLVTIEPRQKLKALEQLAMLHEHQFKDFQNALEYTQKGIELIENHYFLKEHQKVNAVEKWYKRYNRVENKLSTLVSVNVNH